MAVGAGRRRRGCSRGSRGALSRAHRTVRCVTAARPRYGYLRARLVISSPSSSTERRRSGRVALRLPVEIEDLARCHRGATVVVNDDGALIVSAQRYREGDLLTVRNLMTGRAAVFRVTSARPRDVHLKGFPLGVAIVDGSAREFWGALYDHMNARRPS